MTLPDIGLLGIFIICVVPAYFTAYADEATFARHGADIMALTVLLLLVWSIPFYAGPQILEDIAEVASSLRAQ